jgi:4-hydroxybenzoyl-CoA thioesterase
VKFSTEFVIRFQHCDPAGIVFYPRYVELLNQVVEDWFARGLQWPFSALAYERREGIPMVKTEYEYYRPSRIGDVVRFDLAVAHLGRSSFTVEIIGLAGDELRLRGKLTAVYVSIAPAMKSLAIPPELRSRMEQYLAPADNRSWENRGGHGMPRQG